MLTMNWQVPSLDGSANKENNDLDLQHQLA
jgi:hypothetical protein